MHHLGNVHLGSRPGGHGVCACFSVLVMLLIWALAYVLMPYEVFEEIRMLYYAIPLVILAWGVSVYLGLHALGELLHCHHHH